MRLKMSVAKGGGFHMKDMFTSEKNTIAID